MHTEIIDDELQVTEIENKDRQDGTGSFDVVSFKPVLKEMWTDQGVLAKQILGKVAKRVANVGDFVKGQTIGGKVVSFITTPYEITSEGRTNRVTSITVVVFTGENAVVVANKQLERDRASVLDAEGKPTKVYKALPKQDEKPNPVDELAEKAAAQAEEEKKLAAAGGPKE